MRGTVNEKMEPTYRLRAFDWIDYLLYVFATAGFVFPTVEVLTKGISTYSNPAYKLSINPSYSGSIDEAELRLAGMFFIVFVVLVYVRNYIVMHRIDNRREANILVYDFVSYNSGLTYHLERLVRALIVLWVLTSTVGVFPPLTNIVIGGIKTAVVSTLSQSAFEDITPTQAMLTYYGVVIVILFLLFLIWDLINVFSLGSLIKSGVFHSRYPGNNIECCKLLDTRKAAVPDAYRNIRAVYSIVAYMRPLGYAKTLMDGSRVPTYLTSRKRVAEGRLLLTYLFSLKFLERVLGLAIGVTILSTVWIPADWAYAQPLLVVGGLTAYFIVLVSEWSDTISSFIWYLPKYFAHPPQEIEFEDDQRGHEDGPSQDVATSSN